MGGVDLADMLIALDWEEVKMRRWYIKVFWHLVDTTKVNTWILYHHHYEQCGLPGNKNQSLLIFSQEIAEGLIHAIKAITPGSSTARPSKRKSVEESVQKRPGGKKPAI